MRTQRSKLPEGPAAAGAAGWRRFDAGLCLLVALLSGCGIGSARRDALEIEAEKLAREKAELTRDLLQCTAENVHLAEQINVLTDLPEGVRRNPYQLTRIRITPQSGFYDKDDDGTPETCIVYVQPIDRDGDIFKAAGAVHVRLWDPDSLGDQPLLAEWHVQPDDLRRQWFDTLISASYRCTFDTPPTVGALARPLTITVTFTDYLTGEIFKDQRITKPRLD